MSDREALSRWLQGRASHWQALDRLIDEERKRSSSSPAQLRELIDGYRSLGHDQALAQTVAQQSRLPSILAGLRGRAHELIFRPASRPAQSLLTLYRDQVPAVWRELRLTVGVATSVFLLAILAGWMMLASHPELAGLFLAPETISKVQQGELWTDGLLQLIPGSLLSLQITLNNILVTMTAVVLGVLFGLGTLYIVILNGFMLGALFAFTHQHGLSGGLLEFVVAHGFVELSVIVIASAGGFRLGQALAQPGDQGRRHSFERAVRDNARLLALCVPALVVCGLIEGYISPDPRFNMTLRLSVGITWWVVFMLLLTGRMPGLQRRLKTRAQPPPAH